jgi:hypothetical protein
MTGYATTALAFHCPADVKAIDHALPKAQMSQAQKAQVMSLRNEGEALHKAGSHKESVGKLSEAMRLILNNM